MKNLIVLCLLILCSLPNSNALNPSYKEKLELSCRIYGFMKYYHSEVSTCQVDWDQMTRDLLPKLKDDISADSFNNLISAWLNGAGAMQKATTALPNIDPALRYNLQFGWISGTLLRQDIRDLLDTVRVHFRPHPSCWVKDNDYQGNYSGWLVFPKDSITYKGLAVKTLPDETTRLLSVFKYWNIIRYFSPNNDITNVSWDSALSRHILPIASINNVVSYYFHLKQMSSYMNDVHAEGLSSATYIAPPTYYYSPLLVLRYIEGQYTVVQTSESGVDVGFVVNKINSQSIAQMEDSLRPYLSSGNPAVFHRSVCSLILNGYPNSAVNVEFIDNSGVKVTKRLLRNTYIYQSFFSNYYPSDTLKDVPYKKINCDVGYVNMGVLVTNQVTAMYTALKDSKAIIFDIRNYPNGTVFDIADLLFPDQLDCALFKVPDVEYPGTFFWETSSFGQNGNTDNYKGKIVLLVDEQTQSHAEYTAMILKAFPGAVVVGSQTAGADGNVVYFNSSWDLNLGYTGLGVYMPDSTNTQRAGIPIDVPAVPTRAGLLAKRDRVLEIGLGHAGCWMTDIAEMPTIGFQVYPNPTEGIVQIVTDDTRAYSYKVIDAMGRQVLEGDSSTGNSIALSNQASGIYTLIVEMDGMVKVMKVEVTH